MKNWFQRLLFQILNLYRYSTYESDPNSIATIRNLLSEASGDIILLSEIQSYLAESLQEVVLPEAPPDMAAQR